MKYLDREVLAGDLVCIVFCILLACAYREIIFGFILYLFSMLLHQYVGGLQTEKISTCVLCTMAIMWIGLYFVHNLIIVDYLQLILSIVSVGILFLIAPVNHPYKELNEGQILKFRTTARIIIVAELFVFMLAFITGHFKLSSTIVIAILMDTILAILGKINEVYKSLTHMFAIANQSVIVNMAHISEMTRDEIIMDNGEIISISRKFRDKFNERMMDYNVAYDRA